MFRTHTCNELRLSDVNKEVTLSGWVQGIRDKGGMLWIDLRDRYGITQLIFQEGKSDPELFKKARTLGREFVIRSSGAVAERFSKNPELQTGEIEIEVNALEVLNPSKVPPFTIEENTDGGDDLRMKYRYLDLRRPNLRDNLKLRHKMMQHTRAYLDGQNFIEMETPILIKSTPEGARDFVVPSRMNPGQFYALPQSPQTFKQLLMISGFDRYYQIVRCFRDEDLRADRQPEFTQIDCEMSFVTREDILQTFEGLTKYLFQKVLDVDLANFPRMLYDNAIRLYGTDKPDIRFEMKFVELDELLKGAGFRVFDDAELVAGINASGCASYSRKKLDELTDFVKRPQVGAKGLVYIKFNDDGSLKSSVDKFFSEDQLKSAALSFNAQPGDLILILAGEANATREALSVLRLHMGNQLNLRPSEIFQPVWIIDFPLLEWDDESERYFAMHHPFTSAKPEDLPKLETDPGNVRANSYDLVINGVEIGGGSIRIHNKEEQQRMFNLLGLTEDEALEQFGFLMNAFNYGAPPHGGIAFGFDRLCAIFGGSDSIRDFIAFPKNNSGRDVMIDSPSNISETQLKELSIKLDLGDAPEPN